MFLVADRQRVQRRVLEMASADPRVVAGAVVGSLALQDGNQGGTRGDRWSDLDLTFAVVDGVPVRDVLDEWTHTLVAELDAIQLFDLPSGTSLYRVFLLPGCLQFDLSFTPASSFGATGPKFRLLFGEAVEKPHVAPPPAQELFGYAVHHALRARFCVERGRLWQAEYWLGELRNCALHLACLRCGLVAREGRGFDDLPADVHDTFRDSFARSLAPDELLRALGVAIEGLQREANRSALRELRDVAATVAPRLRELMRPTEQGQHVASDAATIRED